MNLLRTVGKHIKSKVMDMTELEAGITSTGIVVVFIILLGAIVFNCMKPSFQFAAEVLRWIDGRLGGSAA